MAQTAKLIDVTKTYLPIDPKTFPETLHMSGRDEGSDGRVPVSAYEGKNFLPTSYGYKSYFGTNQQVDSLALTQRVSKVFIYQNSELKNILIALCDTGIWVKGGDVSGNWVQLHTIFQDANPDVYYEWTYAIISNEIFVYMAGQPSYVKLSSSLASPGIIAAVLVPTFLNMAGQLGLFRAGGRLGFWDSANSIAWSDLDTYIDFEPSIETLAGNALFKDVIGKIVTVQAHGKAFIIYSTKSVVLITPSTDVINQWAAFSILSNAGVAYPRQVAVANPDSMHFVFTTVGLYKISKGEPELIIPEVTDFMRDVKAPIYLYISEGRYLFFEILDRAYLGGQVQFSESATIPLTYTFPEASFTIPGYDPINVSPTNICTIMAAQKAGLNPKQQPKTPPSDIKPRTRVTPTFTAYFSSGGNFDAGNIIFGNTPCPMSSPAGLAWDMNPIGVDTLASYGGDTTKRVVTGAQAYTDGNMTMERFYQTQLAIWNMEATNKKAFLTKIAGRVFSGSTKILSNTACVQETKPTTTECIAGRFAGDFSEPTFDYNSCSFWLTRYALTAYDLVVKSTQSVICRQVNDLDAVGGLKWTLDQTPAVIAEWIAGAIARRNYCLTIYPDGFQCGESNPRTITEVTPTHVIVTGYSEAPPSTNRGTDVFPVFYKAYSSAYEITTTKYAFNELRQVQIPPTPDTAYCVKTGNKYTNAQGIPITNSIPPFCEDLGALSGGKRVAPIGGVKLPSSPDGSLCSIPFIPVTIPGTTPLTVVWTTPALVIPAGTFLLQNGSPAPLYPTIYGALVYDLHLKKWGKMVGEYKQLLDYSPLNNTAGRIIPFASFGILAGVMKGDGLLYLFDSNPFDSYITYGKVGYYRLGMTSPEEVIVHFRSLSTGSLVVDTSIDRQYTSVYLSESVKYTNATKAQVNGAYPGAWQNITIKGIFDINYLEYRGFINGRR